MPRPIPAALAALALALPLSAAAEMTEAERQAFRAEVRAYLLENPEVLMEAIAVLEDRREAAAARADVALIEQNRAALLQNPADWSGGNPAGDVVLVKFNDYRCGFCRRAHPEVAELVGSDGNIRFVVKEFPILGEASVISSRFAIAVLQVAGAEAYKAAHDALIALRGEPSPEVLGRLAAEIGVDADAVLARMEAPEVTAVIEANRALADRMGINGTPTYVVAGPQDALMLRGYLPPESMQAVVAARRGG